MKTRNKDEIIGTEEKCELWRKFGALNSLFGVGRAGWSSHGCLTDQWLDALRRLPKPLSPWSVWFSHSIKTSSVYLSVWPLIHPITLKTWLLSSEAHFSFMSPTAPIHAHSSRQNKQTKIRKCVRLSWQCLELLTAQERFTSQNSTLMRTPNLSLNNVWSPSAMVPDPSTRDLVNSLPSFRHFSFKPPLRENTVLYIHAKTTCEAIQKIPSYKPHTHSKSKSYAKEAKHLCS